MRLLCILLLAGMIAGCAGFMLGRWSVEPTKICAHPPYVLYTYVIEPGMKEPQPMCVTDCGFGIGWYKQYLHKEDAQAQLDSLNARLPKDTL